MGVWNELRLAADFGGSVVFGAIRMTDLIERLRVWSMYSFHEMHQEKARDLFDQAATLLERQAALLAEAREALRAIDAWEMPDTGKYWPNEVGADGCKRPMSYAVCYGSNGERDVIRSRARSVLKALEAED